MGIKAVVFDFGGVLVDWSPEYLYRQLIADEAERRRFLTEVCGLDWVIRQDGGEPIAVGVAERIARFPAHEALIRAFYERWHEMIGGLLEGGVATFEKLDAAGVPLFGLTNWSAETFPYAEQHFPLLQRCRDIVVSGRVKLVKPDAAIYHEMFRRIDAQLPGVRPEELVFIDDNAKNAQAASALGWNGIHHVGNGATEARLRALGLPV